MYKNNVHNRKYNIVMTVSTQQYNKKYNIVMTAVPQKYV
jgi:hypothetical protein